MGIQLGPLLETRKITLEELSGQRIAIDGYNVLYQFLTSIRQADGTLLSDSEGRVTSHLSGIFFRFANLVENGLRICLVFDGKPPLLKKAVLEERHQRKIRAQIQWEAALEAGDMETARTKAQQTTRLDSNMINESKELLDLLGIPWIQAPSEGEAQVAHLLSTGKVDYGASQDFDTVLFGASSLVRNLTLSGRRKLPKQQKWVEVSPEIIEVEKSFEALKLTREQLVDVAILMGTDFNNGIDGIGPKKGLKLLQECGNAEDALEKIGKKITNLDEIRSLFLEHPVDDFDPEWKSPNLESAVSFLCSRFSFNKPRVEKALEKYVQARTPSRQLTLGDF
ncbi:MAG: flap endonuclease-1 [Candidatus Thermoplasmatota archaeon]|nr:flap endonuclease-1 [Candidatus Thermoplasmatota archaeon]